MDGANKKFIVWILVATLFILAGGRFWVSTLHDERALEILRKVKDRYATCQTYRDRITITGTQEHLTGTLAFSRPASFLFRGVVRDIGTTRDVNKVYWASSQRGTRPFGGLDTPVEHRETWLVDVIGEYQGKPTYVHGLSIDDLSPDAYQLFVLLMPDAIGMRSLSDVEKIRLVRSEVFNGRDCYVLESRPDKETYWIDSRTYGLIKLEEDLGDFKRTMICNPQFDPTLATGELEFHPPRNMAPTMDYTTKQSDAD